jgi:hypothetical protein
MDLLLSQSEKKFDPQIVNLFFRNISIYPNGTKVILSNGKEALIKEQNDNFPMRPIIKIINESKEENKIINLVNNLNIVIAEAIY